MDDSRRPRSFARCFRVRSGAMKTALDTWTLAQARALWWQKQGLGDATRKGPVSTVIGETGWLRTLAGADVYLAARARRPALTRAELDAAVAAGELRVVPAARGCIYLVPGSVVGDLMKLNAEGWRKTTERDLAKVGSSMKVRRAARQGRARGAGAAAVHRRAPQGAAGRRGAELRRRGQEGRDVVAAAARAAAARARGRDSKRTLEGGPARLGSLPVAADRRNGAAGQGRRQAGGAPDRHARRRVPRLRRAGDAGAARLVVGARAARARAVARPARRRGGHRRGAGRCVGAAGATGRRFRACRRRAGSRCSRSRTTTSPRTGSAW